MIGLRGRAVALVRDLHLRGVRQECRARHPPRIGFGVHPFGDPSHHRRLQMDRGPDRYRRLPHLRSRVDARPHRLLLRQSEGWNDRAVAWLSDASSCWVSTKRPRETSFPERTSRVSKEVCDRLCAGLSARLRAMSGPDRKGPIWFEISAAVALGMSFGDAGGKPRGHGGRGGFQISSGRPSEKSGRKPDNVRGRSAAKVSGCSDGTAKPRRTVHANLPACAHVVTSEHIAVRPPCAGFRPRPGCVPPTWRNRPRSPTCSGSTSEGPRRAARRYHRVGRPVRAPVARRRPPASGTYVPW